MPVATAALLLLFVTAASAPLARLLRSPLPLLQVALGIVVAFLPVPPVGFDPDVFMLLFVPPLLFADAFNMPMRELRRLRWPIGALALGLVVFTTLGCGAFVHWLIPAIPLGAATALAAALSPTDAVAVSGLIGGRRVPSRFGHVLSGEALLNDASGLVCFRFAVAAAATGTFSVASAGLAFLLIALGGLLVGAALGFGLDLLLGALLRRRFDHPATTLAVSALLPFGAYLLAERLGTSGILAAVSAGLALRRGRAFALAAAETRLVVHSVWGVLTFVFNGMIFVLLGMQLPQMLRSGLGLAHRDGVSPWVPVATVLLVTGALLALRASWIAGVMLVRRLVRPRTGIAAPVRRSFAGLVVAGARGAVTLAAISSLPPGFPQRDLLVVLAAGVILCSLLLAAAALPPILSGMVPSAEEDEADRVHLRLARLAAASLEAERDRPAAAGGSAGSVLERRAVVSALLAETAARAERLSFRARHAPGDADDDETAERLALIRRERLEVALRLRLLREQRGALQAMFRADEISDETERLMMHRLDLREEALLSRAAALPREAELRDEAGLPPATEPAVPR